MSRLAERNLISEGKSVPLISQLGRGLSQFLSGMSEKDGYVLRFQSHSSAVLTGICMLTDIKPGPKPKREDGKEDRRWHVNPPDDKKHPTLPVHKHKPGD